MAKKTTSTPTDNSENKEGAATNAPKSTTNKKKKRVDKPVCHICGRSIDEVTLMYNGIAEYNNYICADCIEELHMLNQSIAAQHGGTLDPERAFEEEVADPAADNEYAQENLTPKKMVEYLNKHIIGQEQAKRDVAVAVYNHLKIISQPKDQEKKDGVELKETPLIICGAPGSGKTEIFRKLSEILDCPFITFTCGDLTSAGFVGKNLEDFILQLLQKTNNDLEQVERAIVFLDEFDKISRNSHYDKSDRGEHRSSINSLAVQSQLLKYIEGSDVTVEVPRGMGQDSVITVNTRRMLFVLGGAFVNIEEIIRNRLNRRKSVGFDLGDSDTRKKIDEENEQLIKYVKPKDICDYGFLPEITGRAGNVTYVLPLKREDLRRILVEPESSVIKEYQKRLSIDGKNLSFTEEAYDWIVDDAMSNETGARGLRASVNKIMSQALFDAPSDKKTKDIVIDLDYIHSVVDTPVEEEKKKKLLKG